MFTGLLQKYPKLRWTGSHGLVLAMAFLNSEAFLKKYSKLDRRCCFMYGNLRLKDMLKTFHSFSSISRIIHEQQCLWVFIDTFQLQDRVNCVRYSSMIPHADRSQIQLRTTGADVRPAEN